MENFKKTMAAVKKALGRFFHSKPMRVVGKGLSLIGKGILTLMLIGVITMCIVGCVMTVYVFNTFAKSQDIPDINRIVDNGTSIIYTQDKETGEWAESQRLEGINRIWTDYPDIPQDLKDAVVAIEDERFWTHQGVDWKRTAAAVVEVFLGDGSFGGSTITQQLIKIVSGDNDSTIERKIREIFRALEMERDYYTKDEILEAYLNILPLSDGIVGVGAAANYYFGKDIGELSLAECALVAGVTNLPNYYDPYDHPEHALQRQRLILDKMYELKFITEDEYRQAYGEELVYKNSARYVDIQDYYVDLLIEDVIEDLMDEYGYNYTYAEQLVFFGGLKIYSYEDAETQHAIEAIFADNSNFPDIEGEEENPNAAIFIMDYNGKVVATAGGPCEKQGNRVYNYATQSQRQPGSCAKPIAVYAPAIELDVINYSTVVRDAPIKLADGTLWPPNYETPVGDYGTRTVQYALQQSYNTIPVRILDEIGLDTSYNFLTEKLGFTSLVERDMNYAPLALGGFTYGVTVREMAAAYQIFGNGGVFNSPHTYEKVTFDDEVLLQHIPEEERVISRETATIMNKLLQKVVTQGTAYAISGSWTDTQLFAKTGTTDDHKDSYFAGGSPYYVGALWMGYDSNQHSLSYYQGGQAKVLWNTCMQYLHKDLPAATFETWGDVEGHYYDGSTGIVTGSSEGIYGYYKSTNVPYSTNTLGDIVLGTTPTGATGSTSSTGTTTSTVPRVTITTTAPEETTTTVDETDTTTAPDEETDPTQNEDGGDGGEEDPLGTTLPPVDDTTTTTAPPPDPEE